MVSKLFSDVSDISNHLVNVSIACRGLLVTWRYIGNYL